MEAWSRSSWETNPTLEPQTSFGRKKQRPTCSLEKGCSQQFLGRKMRLAYYKRATSLLGTKSGSEMTPTFRRARAVIRIVFVYGGHHLHQLQHPQQDIVVGGEVGAGAEASGLSGLPKAPLLAATCPNAPPPAACPKAPPHRLPGVACGSVRWCSAIERAAGQ